MLTDSALAFEFRSALRPIFRQLKADRTISFGKIGLLAQLSERGRATASELAAAERISPQAVTVAVRELESLGLVVRTPDTDDRRCLWIELTDAGRLMLAKEQSSGHDWLDVALRERLTAGERASLADAIPLLRKLTADAAPADATPAAEPSHD